MKTAFITGITGQDGAYLAKWLLEHNYSVIGGARRCSERSFWRLKALGIFDKIEIVDFELLDFNNITSVIKEFAPDEFYNLGAMSFVGAAFKQPFSTFEMNQTSVLHMLDSIHHYSPDTKFYQASTSEMFGKVQETPQTEKTPFYPRSPYGIAKLGAYWIVKNYRESYNIHASNGILFNHESPLRGEEFVTQKIISHVKRDASNILYLGNVDAIRDWGHAEDYVRAMWFMLQQEKADDYVVATGKITSVREFVDKVYSRVGVKLAWNEAGARNARTSKLLVSIDPDLYRPAEVEILQGDASKIRKIGWAPQHNVDSLIDDMFNY